MQQKRFVKVQMRAVAMGGTRKRGPFCLPTDKTMLEVLRSISYLCHWGCWVIAQLCAELGCMSAMLVMGGDGRIRLQ